MPSEAGPSGTLPPPRPRRIDHRLIKPSDIQFWADIYSVEVTSNECLTKVRSLLNCRSNMNVARSFRGEEAQAFIDFLDRVSKLHCGTPVPRRPMALNTGSLPVVP